MQPLEYLKTPMGLIWMVICVLLGFALTYIGYAVINRVPAKWLCDYGETPSEELLRGPRVSYKRSGIILSVVSAVCFSLIRLQFNKGYDIYFIMLVLIAFVALMIAVCDFKYTIIPDQFTIALGVLSLLLSVYDLVRGYNILHGAFWSPIAGAFLGGAIMLLIDFLGVLIYKKGGMGFGDVKLFFAIGILTGFPGTVTTALISVIVAALCFAVIIVVSRIRGNQQPAEAPAETAKTEAEKDAAPEDPDAESEEGAEPDEGGVGSGTYLAFGPYIAVTLIAYISLYDLINSMIGAYFKLFV